MLETGEYYCYVSQPNEFKVKFIGDGSEEYTLDNGTFSPAKAVKVYELEMKPGTSKLNFIGISIKSKHLPKGDTYKSEGSCLPIKYLGTGQRKLLDASGNVLSVAKGFIFEMYSVHLLLTAEDLVAKVHPTESVIDYTEEVASK